MGDKITCYIALSISLELALIVHIATGALWSGLDLMSSFARPSAFSWFPELYGPVGEECSFRVFLLVFYPRTFQTQDGEGYPG